MRTTARSASRRHRFGPNPGVYHDGMLFVAPTDSDRVLALEAGTGAVVWEQELPGTGRALLGVAHDRLIVAGRSLLALDAATGARSWRVGGNELRGMTDPESASCGRGIIAGGLVYWPRREDLLMVDVVTGRRERVVPLYQQHGVHGGNLTITSDFLLIAQQNRLSVFSQFGGLRKETRPSVAAATRVVRQ
jgi:cellulose synthase operon protein C